MSNNNQTTTNYYNKGQKSSSTSSSYQSSSSSGGGRGRGRGRGNFDSGYSSERGRGGSRGGGRGGGRGGRGGSNISSNIPTPSNIKPTINIEESINNTEEQTNPTITNQQTKNPISSIKSESDGFKIQRTTSAPPTTGEHNITSSRIIPEHKKVAVLQQATTTNPPNQQQPPTIPYQQRPPINPYYPPNVAPYHPPFTTGGAVFFAPPFQPNVPPTQYGSGTTTTYQKPQKKERKVISIIDPKTGKNVLDEDTTKPNQEEKKEEKQDQQKEETTINKEETIEPPKEEEKQVEKQEEKKEEEKEPTIEEEETKIDTTTSSEQESNDKGIDEDKVVKENPSEIEGITSDEEEDEEEEDDQGKSRVYSRDDLLKFKDLCLQPPEKLKALNIDIFLSGDNKGGYSGSSRGGMRGRGGLPMRGTGRTPNTRGGGVSSPRGRGGKMLDGRGGKTMGGAKQKRDYVAPLQKSSNALNLSAVQDKSEDDKIVDDVKFILNRMTPERYEKLKSDFLRTCTRKVNDEILGAIIDQIFVFAINIQNYSALYARLCADLSVELKNQIGEEDTKKFKRMLLNKCQKEFEQEKKESETKVDLAGAEAEEREFLLRKKKVGNIIFIGELFLKEMLSEKIMHEVIKRLLVNPTPHPQPDEIELLCRLLTTMGAKLDNDKSKKYVNFYFNRMEELTNLKDELPSRSRFMIKDVIEMRQNNWVARIEKAKAKTLQEAREEANKQQRDQDKKIEKHHHNRKTKPKTKSYETGSRHVERYRNMDTRKTLAPGGGELYEKKKETQEEVKPKNAFALLEEEEEEIRESEEEEEDREEAPKEEEEPEPSEEEIKEITDKTRKFIGNYFEEGEVDDTMDDITKNNLHKSKYFIRALLVLLTEEGEGALSDTMKLLRAMKEKKTDNDEDLLDSEIIVDGFIKMIVSSVEEETYMDQPNLFSTVGKFTGRLIFNKVITYSNLYDIMLTCALDDNHPLPPQYVVEILENIYITLKEECEYSDFDKLIKQYENDPENALILLDTDAKYLVNNVMSLMGLIKPNEKHFQKLVELIESNKFGCFEPFVYYYKKLNNHDGKVSDYVELLSVQQVISGILNSTANENPVDNVQEFAPLVEEIKDKFDDAEGVTILNESQYVCFIRQKYDQIKALLEKFVGFGLLKNSLIEQYRTGKIDNLDLPGFEACKQYL